jgi:hypothetical protein
MASATFSITDAQRFPAPTQQLRLECAHGRTSLVLLPGRGPHGAAVAVELLIAHHVRRHHCACPDTVRPPIHPTARA